LLQGGRDADPRQQTLRATIEWSYDLLTEEEPQIFRCLSVFAGGCTLEAAEEVCEADLDTVQSLVEKSLLRFSDGRYWMLETIREYAAERLDESGEAEELRRRHADWFLALAEEAEPHLEGADARVWLDRLEGDYDNVRAALDHLAASGLTKLAFRLVGAMWVFWRDRAHFAEGRRHIESALATDERPSVERGMALVASAALASLGGDAATGRLRAEEALALHRTLGDARGTARSELWLGWALGMGGEWSLAREHFEASLRGLREVGDEFYGVTAALMLAWAYDELGDRARAQTLDEENLGRIGKLHLDQLEATTLDRLSSYAIVDGRLDDAASLATASLRIYHDLGDPHGVAIELRRCGHAFALAGRAELAARLLAAGEILHADLGGTMPWVARMEEEALASVRARLDDAVMAEAWEQGARLTMDEAVALALDSLD
jgi:tetratricopeptide (TPR) repeat protein